MRQTKESIMRGIESMQSKVIANNTVEYTRPDGMKVIRLHNTDILKFPARGGVIFNSGGWKTVTTKQRMNDFQSEAIIFQKNSQWYIYTGRYTYDRLDKSIFYDGVMVKNGQVLKPRLQDNKTNKLLSLIDIYCKELKELKALPIPSGGDCWDCAFMEKGTNRTMGDISESDHLLSHLKEKYIHGSLIFNALLHMGYPKPDLTFQIAPRSIIVRAVRRYFKAKLHLVH